MIDFYALLKVCFIALQGMLISLLQDKYDVVVLFNHFVFQKNEFFQLHEYCFFPTVLRRAIVPDCFVLRFRVLHGILFVNFHRNIFS